MSVMTESAAATPALPPGPRSSALHMVRYFRDPLGCYTRLRARYGDPFSVPFLLGMRMVVTGDPAGIREIFAAKPDTFDVVDRTGEVFMGDQSIILLAGDQHTRVRQVLAQPLHGSRMRAFGGVMQEVAARVGERWPLGKPFQANKETQRISLEIILRALFGVVHDVHVQEFTAAIRDLHDKIGFWVVFVPALRRNFGGLSPWARFVRARDRLDGLVYQQIRALSQQRERPGNDLLSQLLHAPATDGVPAFSEKEMRDQLFTLLMAGHSTTAAGLAWALYWTHRQPAVRARILEEVRSLGSDPEPDAIAELPYLDAVCKETLRIHPIALEVARRLKTPMTLKGHELPAGTVVGASINLVHNDPEIYPEPHLFRPERFLGRKFAANQYCPFGGGHRVCVGGHFGLYEMKIVLATLLDRFTFELASDREIKPVWREGTMAPQGGVPIVRTK